jgi:excisionase family DNA binding protein
MKRVGKSKGTTRYTVAELARMTGLSQESVYKGIAKKEIPSIRIGRRIILPRPMIDEWLRKGSAAA